jgi:hypothetical protein
LVGQRDDEIVWSHRLAFAVVVPLAMCLSGAGFGISTSEARPYQVVSSNELNPSNERTARHWNIVSDSSTFQEHAQTLARAAWELHEEYGLDLTQVTLFPSKSLVGSTARYADGFFAADGKAGQGLPGADPDYRAKWGVLATRGSLNATELEIAELWVALAPEYPSEDPLSSSLVDEEVLRKRISVELNMEPERVQWPHLRLERWRQ